MTRAARSYRWLAALGIRGVRLAGNLALTPIFERWIALLRDLGMTLVASRGGCASDCLSFERVGIPTPLFLQDPLDIPHGRCTPPATPSII